MTTQTIEPLDELSIDLDGSATGSREELAWVPFLLGGALLAVVLYAAFDHGAVGLAAGARVEVAVAAVSALAVAGLITSVLRFRASRTALVGLALLVAFAAWSAVSVLWSVAPDRTWVELNRALSYVLVLGLAICLGASDRRAPTWLATGFLGVVVIVCVYAVGQKVIPGLHVSGVFDLNQTGSIPRLQEPIGYWNALALLAVLGVPAALYLAVDPGRSRRTRLLAACSLELLLLTVGLTLSRGGLVALVTALLVAVAGARGRIRVLAWLALAGLASVPPLVLGLTMHPLAEAGVALSRRETAGAVLAGVLAASLLGLVVVGRALLRREARLRLRVRDERWTRRAGIAAPAALIACGLVAAILTHAWHNFTSPTAPSNVNPNRLLTTDSYRWLWWQEAARAFTARPLGGWGAGSFGVLHLVYRHNTLPVQQPHSVPLQFLSETGVVGALLAVAGVALLLRGAVRSGRGRAVRGIGGEMSMALLAAAVAYLVHSLYDWDWNIPAVTLPSLMFLGALAGAERHNLAAASAEGRLRDPPSLGTRVLGLTAGTLWLCLVALSAVLPSLAASRANAALVQASSPSAAVLRSAQAEASSASSLDPLSDAGLRAEASVALHRGELARARYDLEAGLEREPSDELAWNQLAQVDFFLGDRGGARLAARRVLQLDPRGADARALRRSQLLTTRR